MDLQHWMTFGTFAEQNYFIYPTKETYTGVIINGNMAAHAPEGMAAFILEKNRNDFPYIIDPLTHAFQHEVKYISSEKNGETKIKTSHKTLSENLGTVIAERAGNRPINPSSFDTLESKKDLVKSCMEFQNQFLAGKMEANESAKYFLFEDPTNNTNRAPYCLVGPYFYMKEATYEKWLPLNIELTTISYDVKEKYESKIFNSIVVSRGILSNQSVIDSILNEYQKIKSDGYLFWVDDLDEHSATTTELRNLRYFTSELRNISLEKEVINLHGGYFSVLCSNNEMEKPSFSGVAHGPEFGETRAVTPVGGGIPIAKYYIYKLHNRIRFGDALSIFIQKDYLQSIETFNSSVCDCKECSSVLSGDISKFRLYGESETKFVKRRSGYVTIEYPLKETKQRCLKHYLNMKTKEFNFVNSSTVRQTLDDLESSINEFEDLLGLDGISYLKNWSSILAS